MPTAPKESGIQEAGAGSHRKQRNTDSDNGESNGTGRNWLQEAEHSLRHTFIDVAVTKHNQSGISELAQPQAPAHDRVVQ